MLSVRNIAVYYGKAMALNDVSLEVDEGSVVSIIGANGAGKSTILRAISGLKELTSGEIWFEDKRIDNMETMDIVKLGLVQIPEGRKLFPFLNVLENLKLGASLRKDKTAINRDLEEIFERFPRLKERSNQKAGTLSGGEQQMLAIGRGLMADPKLLMLDEPSLGLSPIMVETIGEIITEIQQKGVTILLVEQNIPLALSVASRGYALLVGKIVLEGDIEKFKSDKVVKQAYLGGYSNIE
ncbi:MAG: ABC transporter ATP-binding protein [Deltaproteobacteria bacterium]|nr:ABC transporter ATP-binding protein [Deltaproteobacteria bacterium]